MRLLPGKSSSGEGKLRVETVLVRICKAENNNYDTHPDADFCFSLAQDLTVLASNLGEEAVSLPSDVKVIVKLGVIAAKMQTVIVVHLECKLRLPNHDFIVKASPYSLCVRIPDCA